MITHDEAWTRWWRVVALAGIFAACASTIDQSASGASVLEARLRSAFDRGESLHYGGDRPDYRPLKVPVQSMYGFPTPTKTLLRMRDDPSKAQEVRRHAWDIFAGLTETEGQEPNAGAVWETWYTRCEVFREPALRTAFQCPEPGNPDKRSRLLREASLPIQIVDASQKGLLSESFDFTSALKRGGAGLASVLYNGDARHHIQRFKLDYKDTLDGILHRPSRLPAFPAKAVVLKAMWHIIHRENPETATLHVWDPKWPVNAGETNTEDDSHWKRSVVIDTDRKKDCNLHRADGIVSINCFYYIYVDQEVYERARFNAADLRVNPGDFAVLVGLHVTTKKIPNWVWATFWWHPFPSDGPYGDDRPGPEIIKGVWRNYLMDTTLSEFKPPDPHDGKAKICFNPYLEAPLPNGIVSNCMTCHETATYSGTERFDYTAGLPWRTGGPPTQDYFKNLLKVDFLWSLTDPIGVRFGTFTKQLEDRNRMRRPDER